MVDKRLKLLLPSKPESLDTIRQEVNSFVCGTVFEERVHDILLVVSEAGTNVVRHAYSDDHGRQLVVIECALRPESLTIFVCDKGRGIGGGRNRTLFTEEGGFGLYLMKELADKFKCHSSRFGTIVELEFEHEDANPTATVLNFVSTLRLKQNLFLCGQSPSTVLNSSRLIAGASRDLFNISPLGLSGELKAYIRTRLASTSIAAQTRGLEATLHDYDYDSAISMLGRLSCQIEAAGNDYVRIPPKRRQGLKEQLEKDLTILKGLEKGLTANEESSILAGSGIYGLIRQREVINLLSGIIGVMETSLANTDGCWISLDETPLQLV